MKEIYLYGAGGHAKVIAEMVELQGLTIAGIFDDNDKIQRLLHYPVLGGFLPEKIAPASALIVSVGNNKLRKKIAQKIKSSFGIAIHPSVSLSSSAVVGEGSVLMAGVTVNSDAHIGMHVILNTQCCVEHDCWIGDYSHISPHAVLAGEVKVGEGTHIGIGACVIQGINIGKWCTIGAGAVIIKHVPDGATVVGNPGKIIKWNSMKSDNT